MPTPTHRLIHALCAFILTTLSSIASAQCTSQWTSAGGLPGVDGNVTCSTVWEHKGTSYLVVGGPTIRIAGDNQVRSFAAFDGTSWHPLGSMVMEPLAMTTYNGELIAWDYLGHNIHAWDGQSWHDLGNGVVASYAPAVTVYHGELFVGGSLGYSGSTTLHEIARWNGSSWTDFARLSGGAPFPHQAMSMCVYNDELIIGGSFTTVDSVPANNIARWNGTEWRPLGSGLHPSSPTSNTFAVWAMTEFEGDLIACGQFDAAGGVAAIGVARWNGSVWQPIGTGLGGSPRVVAARAGELFVGGTNGFVSRWNGSVWANAGPLTNPRLINPNQVEVRALAEFQGDMFVGGSFTLAGANPLNFIGRWNVDQWVPVGDGWTATMPLVVFNGEAIVSRGYLSGDPPARIGAWNGSSWRSLNAPVPLTLSAAVVYHGELFGAGTIGPGSPAALWKWTGSTWQCVSTGLSQINALAVFNDQIVAAGAFRSSTTGLVDSIARWDGSTWQPLGSGVQGVLLGFPGILALEVYNGELFIGGYFDSAGGAPKTGGIARWDGASWRTVGSLPAAARDFAIYHGDLIASGVYVPNSGSDIARWDGQAWHALSPPPNSTTTNLEVFEDELICTGSFALPTGTTHLARWNGFTWRDLGGDVGVGNGSFGATASVWNILAYGNDLIIGGSFTLIPGGVSANLAHWRCTPCYPNCDSSSATPLLNINDFMCFLNRFAAADPYANCDASTTPPILTASDFQCFLNQFAAGCP